MQDRLGKLVGGVAIIRIGAESEIEMKEKKDRVDDALAATRAAVDEGIVAGGGVSLRSAIENIEVECENDDQETGAKIIKEACKAPFKMIMDNAGLNPEVIWNKIKDSDIGNHAGFDARNENVVNMFDAGIIDPVKVTRVALEKAASVAGTMLITECVLTDIPSEKDEKPQTGIGMM